MGAILNKSNTSIPVIYPESSVNETIVDATNESVLDIDESPETEQPMERGVNESDLINKLDKDGYNKLKNLPQTLPVNSTNQDIGDALVNIMKSGADEFKQKTGRNMTYAEMRAAYG
jgi:protein-tyrosine-phosphatase